MKKDCPEACLEEGSIISASRVAMLAVDTGLGIQGVPVCDPERKCRRCKRRRCRC